MASDTKRKIIELAFTDPIIHRALSAYADFEEAVCVALIAHARDRERILAELIEAKSGQPVVFKVSGPLAMDFSIEAEREPLDSPRESVQDGDAGHDPENTNQ